MKKVTNCMMEREIHILDVVYVNFISYNMPHKARACELETCGRGLINQIIIIIIIIIIMKLYIKSYTAHAHQFTANGLLLYLISKENIGV